MGHASPVAPLLPNSGSHVPHQQLWTRPQPTPVGVPGFATTESEGVCKGGGANGRHSSLPSIVVVGLALADGLALHVYRREGIIAHTLSIPVYEARTYNEIQILQSLTNRYPSFFCFVM
jgi:hypothetical protein